MKVGYIKNYNPTFIKQIKRQVGILNGTDLNLASLQNTNTINTMIGIVILGLNLMINPIAPIMVKFENYL